MDVLVLNVAGRSLCAKGYVAGERKAVISGTVEEWRAHTRESSRMDRALEEFVRAFQCAAGRPPSAIAVYVPLVTDAVTTPCLVTESVLALLEEHGADAPLHLPHAAFLLRRWRRIQPEIPQALLTGADFFDSLPEREARYALDPEVAVPLKVRRRGFHGLYHQAASRFATRQKGPGARILSVCLEPRPEVAAIRQGRPLMVTGGATPLEGLPGHTTCGELDPGVVLALALDYGWGPERIHMVLTRKSGLLGLAGCPTTLRQALLGNDPARRFAGDVLRYRLLLACGAGMAALSGVDVVVFSGRYATLAWTLGPWLCERLTFTRLRGRSNARASEPVWMCTREPLERLIADEVVALFGYGGKETAHKYLAAGAAHETPG